MALRVPASEPMTEQSARSSQSGPAETVLVIEPEVLVRVMVSQYLRECGYRVVEAVSADEALILLRAPDIQVSVVLCTVHLPGAMNGFGLAKWVRANLPNTDVILATNGTQSAKAAGELCEHGPMLTKPYDHKLLADQIKRLLAERRR
jgi:CheY-like chemotaxis protein